MNRTLTAVLGLAVGLALVALLMVPTADPDTLTAQGAGSLLKAPFDETPEEGQDVPSALFAALDEVAGADAAERRLRLETTLDGAPLDAGGETDAAFRRAFGSSLNLWNARTGAGAPYRLDDQGPLRVGLDVVSGADGVALSARLSGARGEREVLRGEARWVPPDRLSLVPPLLAVIVALIFRRTLLALFLGVFAGAVLARAGDGGLIGDLLPGLVDVFGVYFYNELVDTFRIEIIGFVVALVAMVGVMSRSGGVQGLVERLVGFARTVRSTLLVTWAAGILIFFDDYANCLLVGNTMRPLSDRMRISREKLAYIVDSTAAPIAGVSLLSTWIAFEVSTYAAQLPGAGITDNAYAVFLQTIPFRYYCLFTIMFVGATILLGRDYGPMLTAERRARSTGRLVREGGTPMVSDEATRIEPMPGLVHRARDGALPILTVLVATLAWILVDGGALDRPWSTAEGGLFTIEGATGVLFDGSGGKPIFLGASAGLALAAFLAGSRVLRVALVAGAVAGQLLSDTVNAWLTDVAPVEVVTAFQPYLGYGLVFSAAAALAGLLAARVPALATTGRPHLPGSEIARASFASLKALFFAIAILFLAWMIGSVCTDLKTADYLVALLSGAVTPVMLPVLLFAAACLVAFSTGSSWSTMSILLPNVVALSAAVGESSGYGMEAMVVLCIGAVLEGSIFGDHCSPISDTTVLSSVSTASDHIDHVRTQAPYALTTAALAVGLGYVPTVMFDWWTTPVALTAGLAGVLAVLMLVGRTTPAAPDDQDGVAAAPR